MKKAALILIGTALLLASAQTGFSLDGNVRYTVHNMSNTYPVGGVDSRNYIAESPANGGTTEICIFCHTPHNAKPAVPLWNKVMPSGFTYDLYSSGSLSSAARSVATPGPESLLCLSCHDGRTAVNVLVNPATTISIGGLLDNPDTGGPLNMGYFSKMGRYGANLGKLDDINTDNYAGSNLMDDHPISFSYTNAQTEKGNGILHPANLVDPAIRFFGPEKRLECSSCHDPHVAYGYIGNNPNGPGGTNVGDVKLRPFLVLSNDNSGLCLSCHNK